MNWKLYDWFKENTFFSVMNAGIPTLKQTIATVFGEGSDRQGPLEESHKSQLITATVSISEEIIPSLAAHLLLKLPLGWVLVKFDSEDKHSERESEWRTHFISAWIYVKRRRFFKKLVSWSDKYGL